jgi:hypothetical protein
MELSRGMKTVLIVLSSVLFLASVDACPANQDVKTLLRDEYPKLVLLGFEKGQFTGSKNDEYLAFYEDPRQRYEEDSPMVIWRVVVFVVRSGRIVSRYDLFSLDVTSLDYDESHLKIIRNPQLQFGRWAGYAYVGDYNGNGLEEILFFQLTGSYFLAMIVEYNGKEFEVRLDTYSQPLSISEIRTETRDGKKLLKVYGYGGESIPVGKRDWYLYEWNGKTERYELIEEGVE